MSHSELGRQLYRLLPAVYRERDHRGPAQAPPKPDPITGERPPDQGDLEALLQVYGELLDQMKNTLEQRYYDNFPDRDPRDSSREPTRSCQPWLLPYFAQLVDVDLVSPDTEGQREEVTHAVAWRQRKGTRVATEQIVEAVAQMETEVQEGWQRLARTPRVNDPLLPESHFGWKRPIDPAASPADRARHPGLPSATPDLRYASRALRTHPGDPAAHRTRFDGETQHWIQANPAGTPCAMGSYQDVSQRTPDLRTPTSGHGHFHPRRVLLFVAPPDGLCDRRSEGVQWSSLWERIEGKYHYKDDQIEFSRQTETWQGKEWDCLHLRALTPQPLKVLGRTRLGETRDDDQVIYRFENFWFQHRMTLVHGRTELRRCAARQFHVILAERAWPVIDAHSCLFNDLKAPRGLVQLEYCTVLNQLLAEHLLMTDSITLPVPSKDRPNDDVPGAGCIRYSRLPWVPEQRWTASGETSELKLSESSCTHLQPVFLSDKFGEPGAGVLHWHSPEAITRGAEDGGEMGAYHDARHQMRWQAALDKLDNYLPLGMEAALIPDPSLQRPPPYRA